MKAPASTCHAARAFPQDRDPMKQLLTLVSLFTVLAVHAQWTQRTSTTTQPLYAVQFVNDTGYAVGYYGTVIRSTDRGLSWATMPFPNNGNLNDVYFHDALHGFAAGDSGLFHTVDGGASWSAVATPLQEPWRCITFVSPQVGFCGGGWFGTGALLRTLDGGATWSVVFSDAAIPVAAVQFPTADTGYAIQYSYSWEVLKTTDGGANWSTLPIQPIEGLTNLEGLHFLDADNGYAGGWYLPTFIHTADGGLTWSDVAPDVSVNVYDIDFASPQHGIAVGTLGAILHTYNGVDWSDETWTGSAVDHHAVDVLDDSTAIVVGGDGQVLRWSSATAGLPAITREQSALTVLPNPASDFISFRSTAPLPGAAHIELLDAQGRLVLRSPVREQAPIDVAAVPPGLYAWRCVTPAGPVAQGTVVIE